MSIRFPLTGELNRRNATSGVAPLAIPKVGIIRNPRSRMNRVHPRPLDLANADIVKREPASPEDLLAALGHFAGLGVDLIIVDGGDGTVREVLTAASKVYNGNMPQVALLPSGKTNALALDLGIPADWSLQDAVRAYRAGNTLARTPLTVSRLGVANDEKHGFILGAGAFTRATALAQHAHRKGWFNGGAIMMAMIGAIGQTIFGGAQNRWRRGERVMVSRDGDDIRSLNLYLLLASTLTRLPLGLKPFGPAREGLKLLAIEAPPRGIARYLLPLLRGKQSAAMERSGFIQRDAERLYLSMPGAYILDGERYPAGKLLIGRGDPINFVVP